MNGCPVSPDTGVVRKQLPYGNYLLKKGEKNMPRNSFIQMSKLSNVKGRISYISSRAKQENLYAVYETTDRSYWTELAKCNQQEFKKSGTEGKCIEARELIIALPESFPDLYDPDNLLRLFTDRFREKYGVECMSALHHNKRKTNYHIHLIFSEREKLADPIEKIASRNMFYDEHGKHVRTKKEIIDENGDVRKGCKIVKKGEVYERTIFTAKNKLFKQESFVDEAKRFYTDLINLLLEDDKEKLQVFEKNGLYLATKKIGKNNPKAEQIQADNEIRMKWNSEVDRALVSDVPEEEIRQIKKEYITDKVRLSVKLYGNQPEKLAGIINTAISALTLLIYNVIEKAKKLKEKLFEPDQATDIQPIEPVDNDIHEQAPEPIMIPPRPVMSQDAKAYQKMAKIKRELDSHNKIIFDTEKERNALEDKSDSLKGFQKLTKRGDLQAQIDLINERIDLLKIGLSGIVKQYGYKNVKQFYGSYNAAKKSYIDYQDEIKKWESLYDKSAEPQHQSLHERMQEYKRNSDKARVSLQKADEKNRDRRIYSKDRGAR
jgi:hypothetical protein